MDRATAFLEKYRLLEEELTKRYHYDEKSGSPVVRFINDREGRSFRERLDLCREIRNFLSHHASIGGEPVVEPSEAMIGFLEEVTDYVCRPPLALPFSTQFADILKTSPNQRAQVVMKKMQRQGFSHVPVFESGVMTGIFSVNVFFSLALRCGISNMDDEMLIDDFRELLAPDRHENERYLFLSGEATLFQVRSEFEKRSQRSKRLAAVFLTENGSFGGRLLGMLTPWDVIGDH